MSTRKIITGLGALLFVGGLIWVLGFSRSPAQTGPDSTNPTAPQKQKAPSPRPLLAQAPGRQLGGDPNQQTAVFVEDTIVIPNSPLQFSQQPQLSTHHTMVLFSVPCPIHP